MLALGSTTLGSGVGALVVPVLLEKLIKEYTWRGALLIFAGIVLNCCISAIISGPNKKRNFKRTRIEKTEKQTEASDSYSHATRCSSSTKEKTASKRSLRKIFLSIITTKSFLLYNLSIMMGFSPGIAVMVFFVDYIEAKGIDRSVGVWLYICLNAAAIFGRIVATAVAQMKRIPKLAIPLVFSLVGSLGMLLFPFVDTVPECAVAGWLLGTSLGGMVCVLSVTTIDLIAADDYPLAFGIVTTLLGIANGFAGPLSGKRIYNINVLQFIITGIINKWIKKKQRMLWNYLRVMYHCILNKKERYIQFSLKLRTFYLNKIEECIVIYSVTCLNRIPMGPNILSGLDRIRITQTHLFVKNFCIVVALIIECAYYWMEKHTYATSFQLLYLNPMLNLFSDAFSDKEVLCNNQSFNTWGTFDVSTYLMIM